MWKDGIKGTLLPLESPQNHLRTMLRRQLALFSCLVLLTAPACNISTMPVQRPPSYTVVWGTLSGHTPSLPICLRPQALVRVAHQHRLPGLQRHQSQLMEHTVVLHVLQAGAEAISASPCRSRRLHSTSLACGRHEGHYLIKSAKNRSTSKNWTFL